MWIFSSVILAINFIAVASITPAQAAYTVKPKVGQCFMLSVADVSAPFAQRNPISCSKKHNAETYLVAKWPLSTPAGELSKGDRLEVAKSLCSTDWKGQSNSYYFTYWAWYTPNPKAWAKGERWLRCDAMRIVDSVEPYRFVTWKGKKLSSTVTS